MSPYYWHCRLGHPNLSQLKKVASFSESVFEINCDACQLGKHHRVYFLSKESRSLRPFDLVQLDVWGPYRYSIVSGYRHFITFVDDHFRMTWIYLLKDRSSVLDVFQTFHSEIKTIFF